LAKRKFTIFHLSLKPIKQRDIETVDISREKWIRQCLSNNFVFYHRNSPFTWVAKNDLGNHIFGVIQRERLHESHLPPAQGGGEIINHEWIGAYVIIDPTHHDLGQRVAFENDTIGDPDGILQSLIKYLNSKPETPYIMNSAPIFNPKEFWMYATKNDHRLRTINFRFIAPNMWGTRNALEEDLAETKNQTNANEIDVKLSAEDGVDADSKIIQDGVEYIQRGAGRITAKSMTGEKFDSDGEITQTTIPKDESSSEETRGIFIRLLDIIMGRNTESFENQLDDSNEIT